MKTRVATEWTLKLKDPIGDKELHPDIQRCRMIAGLLRDYGVRHVVISSGARDVSLARLFENNECFITHNVIDERSAVYYALGIANALGESVAVTCTSGTAVSNYLPGITEAYHMQVPIVALTCDRYPQYLDQMEAQKTDHIGALKSVVKASVDLLPVWDELTRWDTRRRVSEALLEMSHHGYGPVHINIPMGYLQNEYPPAEELDLPDYPHIERITGDEDNSCFAELAERICNKKRILIVVGQSRRMESGDQDIFDSFCRRFNCTVAVDHLSNMSNDYTIHSHDVLRKMDQNVFDKVLMPDLVIYFGGKRVLNDPLIWKLRKESGEYEFWRIDEDGKVSDVCFNMTHIIEMKPAIFFSRMLKYTREDAINDGEYFHLWQSEWEKSEHFDYERSRSFSAYHTVGKLMDILPADSVLHLGIGTSFDRAHYFMLNPSVDVFCNMGTNGIDGSASAFMGHAAVTDRLCFLIIGDLSFFYDMNSIWSKQLKGNIRILLNNDGQAGFIKHFGVKGITHEHNTSAAGWVESLGFTYLSASSKEEYAENLKRFVSDEDTPMFFEAFLS